MQQSIIRMANDIAIFHTSFPEEDGKRMVAEHINKFWAPPMRTKLFDLIETDADKFHPLALASAEFVYCAIKNPIKLVIDRSGTGG